MAVKMAERSARCGQSGHLSLAVFAENIPPGRTVYRIVGGGNICRLRQSCGKFFERAARFSDNATKISQIASAMIESVASCPCGGPSCVKFPDRLASIAVQIFSMEDPNDNADSNRSLQSQFEAWRKTRAMRSKTPDHLLNAAPPQRHSLSK